MRMNALLAVGLLAAAGIGGGALLQSNQAIFGGSGRDGTNTASLNAAPRPVRTPSTEGARPRDPNVVRSNAPVRTLELPYYVIHDTGDDLLLSERHTALRVAGSTSEWRMARKALTAMEEAPRAEGRYESPLPDGTRILGVHIDIATGIATVNLSPEFRENFNGGARAEQMTVYAIVNTVGHVHGVKGVNFQIAGKPIDEFAGHLDLSEPLVPDDSIVEKAS